MGLEPVRSNREKMGTGRGQAFAEPIFGRVLSSSPRNGPTTGPGGERPRCGAAMDLVMLCVTLAGQGWGIMAGDAQRSQGGCRIRGWVRSPEPGVPPGPGSRLEGVGHISEGVPYI